MPILVVIRLVYKPVQEIYAPIPTQTHVNSGYRDGVMAEETIGLDLQGSQAYTRSPIFRAASGLLCAL